MSFLFDQLAGAIGPVIPNPLFLTSPVIMWAVAAAGNVFLMAADPKSDFKKELGNAGDISGNVIAKKLKSAFDACVVIGGVICFGGCLFSGIMLGASSFTQNSQSRTNAIISIACAVVGGFVIINAESIAAWSTSI